MEWGAHVQVETALARLHRNDQELYVIAEFMAETGITFDELVSLRETWTRTVIGGKLDVLGWDGPRSIAMSDEAWAALVHLHVPDWCHLADLRARWTAALAPSGLTLGFEYCMQQLAKAREYQRAIAGERDDEVPF
jgi:hypothetical protein